MNMEKKGVLVWIRATTMQLKKEDMKLKVLCQKMKGYAENLVIHFLRFTQMKGYAMQRFC